MKRFAEGSYSTLGSYTIAVGERSEKKVSGDSEYKTAPEALKISTQVLLAVKVWPAPLVALPPSGGLSELVYVT